MGVEHLGVLVLANEAVAMKARLTTIREREVNPFDEIIVGLSVGHLVGKSGLVVGGNSVEVPETGDREWRPFIGMDFTF